MLVDLRTIASGCGVRDRISSSAASLEVSITTGIEAVGWMLAQAADQFEAVNVRHQAIGHDEIRRVRERLLHRVFAVDRRVHVVGALQHGAQKRKGDRTVVDDEHTGAARHLAIRWDGGLRSIH